MAHNDRFYRPSILAPTWVPTPYQIRRLDQQTSESVNGDAGGTWNPAKPLIIGGAGVRLFSAGGFTGGVTTGAYAPDGALLLGDNDWPKHVTPKTRKILFPIRDSFWASADIETYPQQQTDQSIPGSFQSTYAPQSLLLNMGIDGRYLPVGATISEVRLCFSVGVKPATVPANLPNFYFASSTAVEQKFLPTPATVAAYYNDGLPQDIVLVPSTLTTVLAGEYYAFQPGQQSPGDQCIFHSVSVTISNITDMRPGL